MIVNLIRPAFVCFLLCISLVYAQRRETAKAIGYVHDSEGNPLTEAVVHLRNTSYSTEVDDKGHFVLLVQPGEYELVVSSIGYLSKTVSVSLKNGENKLGHLMLKSDPNMVIDQVVITGKSAIAEVRETPFNVVALDARSQYNSTLDLAHLLDKASGVKIRETGGVGSDMSITLNGFTGRNIRVFIDGVPMQGMGSAFQLNNIPVNMAERIEVYKGVVPIEFGADALGGVINIVTNRTSNTTLDASYAYGSFNTHKSNVSFNHTFKSGVSLQVSAFQNYSDNNYKVKTTYRIFAAEKTPETDENGNTIPWQSGSSWSPDSAWFRRFHDTYRNETLIAKVGIVGKPWADRLLLGLTMGQVHKDVQNGAEMKFVYGERTAHSRSVLPSFVYDKRNLIVDGLSVRVTGNYNYEKAGSVDTTSYKYSWSGDRRLIKDLRGLSNSYGEASFGLSEYASSNESGTVNIGYRINQSHSIAVNNVLTHYLRKPDIASIAQTIYPDLPTAADSMTRTSFKNTLGLEYRYTFKRKWNTNVFAKHYLNKASGPETGTNTETAAEYTYRRKEDAGKIGYGIATTYFFRDLQLKASAEKAYRLPTDRELFGDEILEEGNIKLKPEESNNYNIGFTLNKELNPAFTVYVDWSGYYRDTYNFIQTILARVGDDVNGNSIYRRTNHGRVTRLGTDIEGRLYYKNKATIGATLTYMDIRDKSYFSDEAGKIENGNYGYRMPNLPYFFWNADAAYYLHDLFGTGNTLNLNYTLNYVDKIYRNALAYGDRSSKDFIPKQLFSDFTATYIMQNGKYNISFEVRNIEDAMLYDNFSLQKPGRSFAVKLRYFFIKRNR
ncbi:TonB-dependent receptor plug domain-containing protein [Parapedobacter defluvii]|uniref:TonB-dependent receptor plug domain-containing protein n=1 Tax=Parapedobacter defluvii TaxID=2045106 RepID=UPI0033403ACF